MSTHLSLPEAEPTSPSRWPGKGVCTSATVFVLGTPSMWKEVKQIYQGPWSVRFVLHNTLQERQHLGAAQLAACVLQCSLWGLIGHKALMDTPPQVQLKN